MGHSKKSIGHDHDDRKHGVKNAFFFLGNAVKKTYLTLLCCAVLYIYKPQNSSHTPTPTLSIHL